MVNESAFYKLVEEKGPSGLALIAPVLAHVKPLRKVFMRTIQNYVENAQPSDPFIFPRSIGEDEDRAEFSRVFIHTGDRILSHNLSRPYIRRIADNLVNGIFVDEIQKETINQFQKTYHTNPPFFLTISPGKKCNLQCTGCYASSGSDKECLDWHIFDKIISDAKSLWGIHFIVISGGEPLAYRSEGKGILDAVEKHPDIFFLMYTNGTLISDAVAKRMATLGNITPAISVEGWRERTDERRGSGVFDKVVESMRRLRRAGVPFGISLTATRNNAEEIFSDDFLDFFFTDLGALYGWVFHYMPIGRSFTLDLMPSPEQRVWMWKRAWEIIHERHIFLADFWNHGTLTDGCLAAGRSGGGGYLYIDWNGAVSPCVFVPYSPVNINDIYANGGTLTDVWEKPFFKGIRNWQYNYRKENGNLLAPCIIRDHHKDLRQQIAQHEPDPIDESARKALLDPDYARGMEDYDIAYQAQSDPYWRKYYLEPAHKASSHQRPTPENNP